MPIPSSGISLNAFSSEMPLDGIYLTTEEIPDAVGKLDQIIKHLGDAANANLDALERLDGENDETRGWIEEAQNAAIECRERFEALIAEHPELESTLREALVILDTELAQKLSDLEQQSIENHDAIVGMMASQGFQDLTGQTLRKVIHFIESLEFQLVELLKRHAGERPPTRTERAPSEETGKPSPESAAQSQEDVDKLLTDLGF